MYYFENGLPGGDVGLSLEDKPYIADMTQLIEKDFLLLNSIGGPQYIKGVRETRLNELDLAARLAKVLMEMKISGEISRLYEKYYGYPMY